MKGTSTFCRMALPLFPSPLWGGVRGGVVQNELDTDAPRPWALKDGARPRSRIEGFAKGMRHAPTDAERKLWRFLRRISIGPSHFRRQVVVGGFIADFACYGSKLTVEVDGGQHCESAANAARTAALEAKDWRVLRFWNDDVLNNIDGVMEAVRAELGVDGAASSGTIPNLSPQRAGEQAR